MSIVISISTAKTAQETKTKRTRRTFSPAFKAKIAIEAISSSKTLTAIAREFEVTQAQVSEYKQHLINNALDLFKPKTYME